MEFSGAGVLSKESSAQSHQDNDMKKDQPGYMIPFFFRLINASQHHPCTVKHVDHSHYPEIELFFFFDDLDAVKHSTHINVSSS